MSGARQLQEAVHACLTGNAGLVAALGGPKVYDRPPHNAAMPYVTFGATRAINAGTASEEASEHLFTLHVWSGTGGRKHCMEVMEALGTALATLPATNGSVRFVSLRRQGDDIAHEPGLKAWHGIMRYRALTEAVTL